MRVIIVFTDFGLEGPYTGQMKAVLHQLAPGIPVIDLFADAPVGNPKASAYLLAAYAEWFAVGTVFLCVVDPGVGGGRGQPLFSKPIAAGTSAPATACSSWSNAAPQTRALGTSTGSLSTSRPAFTGAISSPRLLPSWRVASRHLGGRVRMTRIARQTGQTICPRSFTSIISVMP